MCLFATTSYLPHQRSQIGHRLKKNWAKGDLLKFILSFMMIPVTSAEASIGSKNSEEEPILVGRISHVEGQLMR